MQEKSRNKMIHLSTNLASMNEKSEKLNKTAKVENYAVSLQNSKEF